jgi:hypothetical protein
LVIRGNEVILGQACKHPYKNYQGERERLWSVTVQKDSEGIRIMTGVPYSLVYEHLNAGYQNSSGTLSGTQCFAASPRWSGTILVDRASEPLSPK